MSLSDKVTLGDMCERVYPEKDVKEFIKDLLEKWAEVSDDDFPEAVKELAGRILVN